MGRPAAPYWRKANGWWVATIAGRPKQKLLKGPNTKANKRRATDIFNRLTATTNPRASLDNMPCAHLIESFLDHAESSCKPNTYAKYRTFLNYFTEASGQIPCRDLTVQHAERLLRHHATKRPRRVKSKVMIGGKERKHTSLVKAWGPNMQATFAQCLRRCFKWGVDSELISRNPFGKLKRSFIDSTRKTIDDKTWQRIMDDVKDDQAFTDFLTALNLTGCRPSEIANLTAAEVAATGDCWNIARHKTDGKDKIRRVWLNEAMRQLTVRLVKEHPTGPLFLNSRGKAWTKNAIVQRFTKLRERLNLPDHVIAYAGRHTYITRSMANRVSTSTLAQMTGTSERMIKKHYGHLDDEADYMKAMAELATQKPTTKPNRRRVYRRA